MPVSTSSEPDEPEIELPLLTMISPLAEVEFDVDNSKPDLAAREIPPPVAFEPGPISPTLYPEATDIDPILTPSPPTRDTEPPADTRIPPEIASKPSEMPVLNRASPESDRANPDDIKILPACCFDEKDPNATSPL